MASLSSCLCANVIHALGWALIHSLWQCLGLAALAAVMMAFSRRSSVRYLIATGVLIAMLAAPVATFLVLMKEAAPVHALLPARSGPQFFVAPASMDQMSRRSRLGPRWHPQAMPRRFVSEDSPRHFLPRRFPSRDFLPPNILFWLVGAWLCGVALLSLRLAGGLLLLEYRCRTPSCVPGHRILGLAHELERQLGLHRAIQYVECGWLQAPAVIGWIRPILLLPVSALTGLNEAQLRAVIAHELAHVSRLDPFVNLLQVLVETLLFYHPAMWWLTRRIRVERELCCDEIAISLTGDRIEYVKVLTLMAEWERAPALAMAVNRGPLSERIFHILGKKPVGTGQRMLGLMGSILLLAAAMGGAHALFGIVSPVPMAHTKAAPQPDHMARQATTAEDRGQSGGDAVDRAFAQVGATIDRPEKLLVSGKARKLRVPRADLAAQLLTDTLLTPIPVAPNDPPIAPAQPASGTILAAAVRTTAPPKPATCALPAIVDSVGLMDVPGTNLRTVPATINGTNKQFLLDIGTDLTEVSQAAVTDLGLPDADNSLGSGEGLYMDIDYSRVALFDVNGSRSANDYRPHVRVASFTIGDATAHNLPFVVARDPEMGKSKHYDGLMTGDFFKRYDVELDFAQNKLDYLTPTSCTDPDQVAYWPHAAAAAIPITKLDGKIQVEVSIQGHAIPAVIDTSSAHTVMRRDVAELVLGLNPGTSDMMPDGDLRDGMGQQVYLHTFSKISFAGGVTAYNVPALIQDYSMIHDINRTPELGSRALFYTDPSQRIPSLTLGMDVLSQLHLYLVYRQQTLYVTEAG